MDLTLGGLTVGEDEGPLAAWPVGSIYMGVTPTSPAVLFGGGTWERWGIGRVAVSLDSSQEEFNVVEKEGGSKSSVVPNHNHSVASHNHTVSIWSGGPSGTVRRQPDSGDDNASGTAHTHAVNGVTGGNAAQSTSGANTGAPNLSVLQPYITCYMWKRTE